jgi:protein-tyrosine phosphatase
MTYSDIASKHTSQQGETTMHSLFKHFARFSITAVLASATLLTSCAVHARVYDPYYHDYHPWNDHEVVFYGQWEHDTHRDHQDFNKRKDSEKKEYWDWRHSHDDHH